MKMWIAVVPRVYTVRSTHKQNLVQRLPTPSTKQYYCNLTKLNQRICMLRTHTPVSSQGKKKGGGSTVTGLSQYIAPDDHHGTS